MNLAAIKAAALAAKEMWPSDSTDKTLSPVCRHIYSSNPAAVLEMCAEIERLQSLATTAMEQHEIVGRLYQESVKEIERLHEEIRTEQRLSCREQVLLQQEEIERYRQGMWQALDALKQLDGITFHDARATALTHLARKNHDHATHTPGPWTVEELAAPKSMPLIAGPRMGDRMPLVATAEFSKRGPIDHDQACANARLIAAAPELLEAAKRLLSWERLGRQTRAEDTAFAQQAIAKAEGAEGGK